MDKLIQINKLENSIRYVNLFFQILFIFSLYAKFVFLVILKETSILLDILLYISLLLSINYKRFSYFLLAFFSVAVIAVLNPAFKNIFLIVTSLYILSSIEIRSFIKLNLFFQFSVFILASIFLSLGITKSELLVQLLFDSKERWDYGMGNPNTFSLFIYSILINIYILYGRKNVYIPFIILIISYYTYSYAGSRTFLFSIIVLFFTNMLGRLFRRYISAFKIILILIPILMFAIIVYCSSNVNEYEVLNLVMSGRLELYSDFINSLSIKDYLIGTPLVNEETVDSSYLHIFFEGGMLFFCFFLYLYINMVKKISVKEAGIIMPYLCSVWAAAITESLFTYILIFGNMIFWFLILNSFRNNYVLYKE